MPHQIHGSCVDISGTGVLLRGPSGSGKSDLALRLIDEGAFLVADDRVDLAVENGVLVADAPAKLAGLIEIRGMGIMRVAAVPRTVLSLIVELVDPRTVERMPEPMIGYLLGVELPLMRLCPQTASAAAKLRLAVGADNLSSSAGAAL